MNLAKARRHAEHIFSELSPMCARIEIAGSIRRQRPMVNDIDIVLMPKPGFQQAIRTRCLKNHPKVLVDGTDNLQIVLNGIQVDIYYVVPPSPDMFLRNPLPWGTRLLCRTGSKQFNIWFASEAAARGMHWNPYWGLYRAGLNIAAETEEEMFAAMRIPYIAPKDREK
jgi:DNA polymerase (family 10)